MTIHRYEVTDAEWAIIEPMLPKHIQLLLPLA